jgi:hypothetical protein
VDARYRQGILRLGRLELDAVASVAISDSRRNADGTLTETVDFLRLRDGAHFSVIGSGVTGSDALALSGVVTTGTPAEATNSLAGIFTWDGKRLIDADIRSLNVSLQRTAITPKCLGVDLVVPPTTVVRIAARGPLVVRGTDTTGTLELSIPTGRLGPVNIRWGEDEAPWNLQGRRISARIDLPASVLSVESATFVAANARPADSRASMVDYFPGHQVKNPAIFFEDVQLVVTNTAMRLQARRISAQQPEVTFEAWPMTKVVGVAAISASGAESVGGQWKNGALEFPRPHAAQTRIDTDYVSIVDRVNSYSFVNPEDVLVPTGYEPVPYATLGAFTAFHTIATRVAAAKLISAEQRRPAPARPERPIAARLVDSKAKTKVELYLKNQVFAEVRIDSNVLSSLCNPSDTTCLENDPRIQLPLVFSMGPTPVGAAAGALMARLLRPGLPKALQLLNLERAVTPIMVTVASAFVDALPKIAEQAGDALLEWETKNLVHSQALTAWSEAIRRGDFATAQMTIAFGMLKPIIEMEANLRADQQRDIDTKYEAAKARIDQQNRAEGARITETMKAAPGADQTPATAPGANNSPGSGQPSTTTPPPQPCPPGKECLKLKPKCPPGTTGCS